ncbi:MAG: coenzyme A pyrophosphatase, partial [Nitrosopumilus sp.]|nr:coenzyme A pyrophosphatase [Nitrosopumilus sp.]
MLIDDLRLILASNINPALENKGNNKLASILVIIYGNPPIVVMTEKPKHMTLHAGEISFPGGKLEPNDSNLLETALRET